MRADLHAHSAHSDGSDTIERVVALAAECGVTHLSVTDHDTVSHVEELREEGGKAGMATVSGIEISAFDPATGRKVHVLGYGFSSTAAIRGLCDPVLRAREEATLGKIETLARMGYPVSEERVRKANGNPRTLYKQHIMKLLVDEGVSESVYGRPYRELFGKGGPCSGDIRYPDCREAVAAVAEDGGLAVLAHPGQQGILDLVPLLVDAGLRGIEFYHESHRLEDHKSILAFSARYGLFLTGGSDSHGSLGSVHRVGGITAPHSVFSSPLAERFTLR